MTVPISGLPLCLVYCFIFQQFLNACDTERVSLHSLNSPDVVNGSCLLLGSTLKVRMRQWEVGGFCFPCLAGVPRIWGGAFSAFLPRLPMASILCFIFVEVLGCKRVPCPSPTSSRRLLCRVLGLRELLLLPQMGWILLIALLQKQWTFTWALGMGVLPPSLSIWLLLYVRYRSRKLQSTPALADYCLYPCTMKRIPLVSCPVPNLSYGGPWKRVCEWVQTPTCVCGSLILSNLTCWYTLSF